MDAGACPYGVALAPLSPDSSTSQCAAHSANYLVVAFCRLTCPNPYRRFADTAICWSLAEGQLVGIRGAYPESISVALLLGGYVEDAGQEEMNASPQPPHTAPAPPARRTPPGP